MKIEKLRTNHLENPIGYRLDRLSLSWVVTEAEGTHAAGARVQISSDETFQDCLWDSRERTDLDSLDCVPEFAPLPGLRYYWRVWVWDDMGDGAVSAPAYFETAQEMAPAKWIKAPFAEDIHPLFRKEIVLDRPVKQARLVISGLGVYEAYLNGEKVGDEYLTPFYNDYNLWIQYQTYDVTGSLRQGDNLLGVMLGNGWYKGRFGFVDNMDRLYGDTLQWIGKLTVVYEDGSAEDFCSDESWQCGASPVLESSIYDGEVYDSRRELWGLGGEVCQAGGVNEGALAETIQETEHFEYAVEAERPKGRLTPRLSLPVRIMERIRPVELICTGAGEQVLDFGQNMVGWVEFFCQEPEGTEICFRFGEILQEGNFYSENLRTAKQEFRCIANGKRVLVRPHFTFFGFRYMKITGMKHIDLQDFTGCVLYSDMEWSGRIVTSNPKVNRLFLNALWGQKGNFLDVPTDCPQRDERMGWTGDAQVFCQTASYNMYTPAFYRKYLYDMKQEQDVMGGAVPHVVPDALSRIKEILSESGKTTGNVSVNSVHSSCAWADAAAIIPWTLYKTYGDRTLLAEEYGNMKAWTDRIRTVDVERCGGGYLWTDGFHYADWLSLDNYKTDTCIGATDPYYVASAYYYYSASLTAKAAAVLGKKEEAAYYEDMAGRVKAAIRREYFTETGRLAVPTQTAMVLALRFDLVSEEFRDRLVRDLKDKLAQDHQHLTTGFVGTPFLCPVLTEHGLASAAYDLLLNEDYPSWLYQVNMGATTVWERWNSVLPDGRISDTGMNSLNHYSYGSIAEWMYRYMCGVDSCEEAPGFRRFQIKPYVDRRFQWVSMEYDSAKGRIKSGWEKTECGYRFRVEVPFDTEADFVLTRDFKALTVNGEDRKETKRESRIHLVKGTYEICGRLI